LSIDLSQRMSFKHFSNKQQHGKEKGNEDTYLGLEIVAYLVHRHGDVFPRLGRTIKIGVIGPMNFVQGKSHWNGAVMAAEEINAKGAFRSARRR